MRQRIIKPEAFLRAEEAVKNGRFGPIGADAFELLQEETLPLEGYKEHENFPLCCNEHKDLFKVGQNAYDVFPNCCDSHHKLNTARWFKKADYSYFPLKLVKTVAYTWHCIETSIDHENWYKEISDYISYINGSYGQFPNGYGGPMGKEIYLISLKIKLESDGALPATKRQTLLILISKFLQPHPEETIEHAPFEFPDMNALENIYCEWLKIFPFEISFFQRLKPHFEEQRPFMESICEPNLYSGLVAGKLQTAQGLVNELIKLTDKILREINTLVLHSQGRLTNAESVQLELLLAERRQQIDQGYVNTSPDAKTRYRRILKAWLRDEKKFVKNLIPIVNAMQSKVADELTGSDQKPDGKPIFSPASASAFFDIIKTHFPTQQQSAVELLLKDNRRPKNKLLFKGSGNLLADAFKQLFDAHQIAGCNKSELQSWVRKHFQFQHRGEVKDFTARYLKDIISTDKDKCPKPLINVVLDKVTGRYAVSQL